MYLLFKTACLSCRGGNNGAIISIVGPVMGLFYYQRGEMMFMIRNFCHMFKHVLLLCLVCFILNGNLALAATVQLYSNYDATFSDPSVLTVVYGDTNSLTSNDNYQSQSNGIVKAYSMTVKYFAVQDVPGFGKFTNELYDGTIYFFAGRDGKLHAESYSDHERDVLASSEFINNLQNMLQSYHPDVYSFLLQMATVQQEKEKQLAQQQLANETAAIQANPAGRHSLADNLWKKYQSNRIQLTKPDLAAYWENNAIHYGSYTGRADYTASEANDDSIKYEYVHMYMKRNDVTDYGQYIIVTKENNMYTCFDYNPSTDTFIIYDNETKSPDYTLHFYIYKERYVNAKDTNLSGKKIGNEIPWTTIDYEGTMEADFWNYVPDNTGQRATVFLLNSRTDGYRLFLQYGKLLK